MSKKSIMIAAIFMLTALVLTACTRAPTPTPAPTVLPTVAASDASTGKSSSNFATKRISGGSVDVDVTPTALVVGESMAFDVSMNTHSVDLSDDLTKISILRDDTGKEYKPTTWEGAGPGGHHRSGVLKFAALTGKPKYVELIIKGLANVTERVFHWDLS